VKVTIQTVMVARPQIIAPRGRWKFKLRGEAPSWVGPYEFEVVPDGYMAAHSEDEAMRDGERLAEALGYEVIE
jgi:hypothetical protein